MPSSLVEGYQGRSLTSGDVEALRGQKFRLVPDFFVVVPNLVAADFNGANSGLFVFTAIESCVFVGMQSIWAAAAASGTVRAKKILADSASAPGAAADANNIDISAAADLTLAANTRRDHAPVTGDYVNRMAAGDKVALASAAGAGLGLAGAAFILQFVWD